jgi:hypothetical protein
VALAVLQGAPGAAPRAVAQQAVRRLRRSASALLLPPPSARAQAVRGARGRLLLLSWTWMVMPPCLAVMVKA